ncbi:hypothetical protein LMG22037_01205 [Paraburkholderia phenoliruptrix]|uniref:Lipoprotein n=1 Tax=Paraburkholderia phenoliruptrix TaxID=252970 RepID=A0A6J5A691_9BURK|nr:hypothetical protein [Paraburkholderia phenoliruptrix]CAB3655515.1 hypothetical protein LMG22037_01205 [Paraburkholderia phenoliruptrix]
MNIATGRLAAAVMITACLSGVSGLACAQTGGNRAGNGGLSAAPSSGNAAGGTGAIGSTLSPTPGLATPGGALGSGPAGGTGLGLGASRVPNNMRANGTSLNQNPDPRVPNLSGRSAVPR